MCIAFEAMIDKAEALYNVIVIAFCCDNNGGSQQRRKDLVMKRPWLFGPLCCAHQVRQPCCFWNKRTYICLCSTQFQIILGDYFSVNKKAAETAEEATGLISWILNHGRVRSVFNEMQSEILVPSGRVITFLVANITRWTTHFVAFDRLCDLKDPLCHAVILRRKDIISGQIGMEKIARRSRSWRVMQSCIVNSLMMEDFSVVSRLSLMTLSLFVSE
jgi:hypothetical protein